MSKNHLTKIYTWRIFHQRDYYIILFLTFFFFGFKNVPLLVSSPLPLLVSPPTTLHFIPKHPIHLSITEMDFKAKGEKTEIQISHKIFIDDLENALRNNYKSVFENSKPNLSTSTQHQEAEKYIYSYLKKTVGITINSQKKEINYIGFEFEDDVIWIYGIVEKPNSTEKESIFIKNMILMDLFDDQRNMLYLTKEISKTEKTKEFLNFIETERTQTIYF